MNPTVKTTKLVATAIAEFERKMEGIVQHWSSERLHDV